MVEYLFIPESRGPEVSEGIVTVLLYLSGLTGSESVGVLDRGLVVMVDWLFSTVVDGDCSRSVFSVSAAVDVVLLEVDGSV